jgi:hypothetical protein
LQALAVFHHNKTPLITPNSWKEYFSTLLGARDIMHPLAHKMRKNKLETALHHCGQKKTLSPSSLTIRNIRLAKISPLYLLLFDNIPEIANTPNNWPEKLKVLILTVKMRY